MVIDVNTHWHLDHSSGNARIRAVHSDAFLYASTAVDRAFDDAAGAIHRDVAPLFGDDERMRAMASEYA